MKKILFASLFITSIILFGQSVRAQDLAYRHSSPAAIHAYPETGNKIVSEIEVNINATRDFRTTFKNATDVKWVQHDKGESVYFMNEGMKMRSSYNRKGKKEYTLRYYDELRMPSELRQRVKSNYYDHHITIVTEVDRNYQTYYLVQMENEKEYLTLRIGNDEMTIFEKKDKVN
jgi:hypothetical protein